MVRFGLRSQNCSQGVRIAATLAVACLMSWAASTVVAQGQGGGGGTIGTGNTSGVAVVLEAARILKAVGAKPRRTIRIALWSGEEQGLWGSRAYVRQHFGNPNDSTVGAKPGYGKLSVYFNQDYGPGQYQGIYLQGNEQARAMLTAWMQPFRDFGMTVVSNQSVGSTDHV